MYTNLPTLPLIFAKCFDFAGCYRVMSLFTYATVLFLINMPKNNNSTRALDLQWRNYCSSRYGAYFRVALRNLEY